ncbi:hypothetical protein EDB96_2109 [Flavobacterium sp. S87F.05.LMB.W.Kidney.N]|nr:hypothetical protein EDB96_2109 [Flavobacterium sp. S87F.05.LMB.W.Kidney.N]
MNICKWCNKKVSDHDTVWYRRNLILGYSFCSNRCATQWKNSSQDSNSKSNNSSKSISEDVSNQSFEYGNFTAKKPKHIKDYSDELKSIQSLQNQLSGKSYNNNNDVESAKKVMSIVRKLVPRWKVIVPILIGLLAVAFYLNTIYGQILSYIIITLIASAIWAYFTERRD